MIDSSFGVGRGWRRVSQRQDGHYVVNRGRSDVLYLVGDRRRRDEVAEPFTPIPDRAGLSQAIAATARSRDH
jgi:hypothetical protein